MKIVFAVLLFAVLLSASVADAAVNPADLTVGLRYSSDFLYAIYGGQSWLVVGYKDIGNETSVELMDSHMTDDGKWACSEVAVTKRITTKAGTLNVGLGHDFQPDSPDKNFAMVDWCQGDLGIGAIVPFRSEDPLKIGLRYQVGKATLYLAEAECGVSMANCGIGYNAGPVVLQASYGDGFSFRIGKSSGRIMPELRTSFDEDETTVELATGICF